jgi:cytochrome d ubiquinol oxidase subunit II
MMTGIALVFGYALLGSTWLIMKTDDLTQKWARLAASYVSLFVAFFMLMVSVCMPVINPSIWDFWFSWKNLYYLVGIPLVTLACFINLWHSLFAKKEYAPFIMSICLFLMGYIGLGLSIYPWIVPFHYTVHDAAAVTPSLSLMLIGVVIVLPLILSYTAFAYYVFRGKTSHEPHH